MHFVRLVKQASVDLDLDQFVFGVRSKAKKIKDFFVFLVLNTTLLCKHERYKPLWALLLLLAATKLGPR